MIDRASKFGGGEISAEEGLKIRMQLTNEINGWQAQVSTYHPLLTKDIFTTT